MTPAPSSPPPARCGSASGLRLTGKARKYLRGLAHGRKAVVRIGQAGLTAHELVKVHAAAERGARRRMARELASRCAAELVGELGSTFVLYRPHPERPRIALPGPAFPFPPASGPAGGPERASPSGRGGEDEDSTGQGSGGRRAEPEARSAAASPGAEPRDVVTAFLEREDGRVLLVRRSYRVGAHQCAAF